MKCLLLLKMKWKMKKWQDVTDELEEMKEKDEEEDKEVEKVEMKRVKNVLMIHHSQSFLPLSSSSCE